MFKVNLSDEKEYNQYVKDKFSLQNQILIDSAQKDPKIKEKIKSADSFNILEKEDSASFSEKK